jgi:hypothetical protein
MVRPRPFAIVTVLCCGFWFGIYSVVDALAGDKPTYREKLIQKIDAQWPQRDEWIRIGICETGLDWQWNSGTYQGALGFYYGTWDAYRPPNYPSEAYNAIPLQQMVVADRVEADVGITAWGCSGAA